MATFQATFTEQELEDIRMAVIAKWFEIGESDSEKSARLEALMDKLAQLAVNCHA